MPADAPEPFDIPALSGSFEQSVPLWKRPERLIKDYIAGEGGEVAIPARHLRSSWDLTQWSAAEQRTVESALNSVDVTVLPSLIGTDPDDEVTLFLEQDGPDPESLDDGGTPATEVIEPEPAVAEPEPEVAEPEPEVAEPEPEPAIDLPPPLAPAGWYSNPAGRERERWWDGKQWTERLRS